jgi:acyl dehydratase
MPVTDMLSVLADKKMQHRNNPRTAVPDSSPERFAAGQTIELGPLSVGRDEIVAFAAAFDPQPMHLDETAAAASMLGGLAASGWHTCCLAIRALGAGALGTGAPGDANPLDIVGVDEVRWRAPLRPDERYVARLVVLEAAPPAAAPEHAIARLRLDVVDARGARSMSMMMRARLAPGR